jgi:hypothetical protein
MDIPPIPETPRTVFQDAAQSFISTELGPKVLAYTILEEIKRLRIAKTVIDGIRHTETLRALQVQASCPVAVIYIHTPPDVAYELYTSRNASKDALSPAQFATMQNAIVESHVRYLIDDADIIIYNWFGLDSYRFVVRELIRDLGLHKA